MLRSRAAFAAVLFGAALLPLATLGGCGDDPPAAGGDDPSFADGGGPNGLGDGGNRPPPTPAEFGLDARPTNATCKAPARPPSAAKVKLERAFANVRLAAPMAVASLPGDKTRLFVLQRGGQVVSFPVQGAGDAPTVVLQINPLLGGPQLATNGEGGMLGMAFHPRAAQNGQLFLSFTTNGGANGMRSVLGRVTTSDGGRTFGQYREILSFDQVAASNHKGGGLAFGKDGYLYAGFGDGGGGDDQFVKGQTKDGFFSKILRLDVDGAPAQGRNYGIPASNPFANGGGEAAVYAWGFRNPFRISLDRETGELWVADVGQNKWEEINRVRLGGNYGWPCREGMHDYIGDARKCPSKANLTDPIYEYEHTAQARAKSITGGVVYRGRALAGLQGTYLFADYETKEVWTLTVGADGKPVVAQINDAGPTPASGWVGFGEDDDGEVYALDLGGGIYKLTAAEAQAPSTFPEKLSQTGCMDANDPTVAAAGLVAYGVNSPLWSDGADKERWMALPDGQTITVGGDGDFEFPVGTVLVKSFRVAGKLVETRLMVRHADGAWGGYTYEWDDAQKDATLLAGSKTKAVGNVTWYYPSRADCFACHTQAAGHSLGLELGQQNGDFVYPTTNRISNQLKTLERIGMFSAPLGRAPDAITAYPDPSGTGTDEAKARSYLHANCAFCHVPGGSGRGAMDLRFATAFADTKTCDVAPETGDLGVADAKLIAPGNPDASILSVRMHATNVNRMPPVASGLVDPTGTRVVDAFVRSLRACP